MSTNETNRAIDGKGANGASDRNDANRMPLVFVAHGAPPLLDDKGWMGELTEWGKALPRPRSILVVSAHWEARPAAIGATRPLPLVYDFYGFPARYYETKYPSPGAPELAARVRELLDARGIAHETDETRGLDHGVYIPLLAMYPAADIPVLQVSLPGLDPKEVADFGRALGALADEGVLVMGSGFLTHNLRTLGQPTPGWAREFDSWSEEKLRKLDLDALIDFRAKAPAANLAHPRHEHYAPALVTAGAAIERGRRDVAFPITGFWNGMSFTKRSVQIT
jgi:4,5-DOPA dioxygenase extradiol